MLTDAQIRQMSPAERVDLVRRLAPARGGSAEAEPAGGDPAEREPAGGRWFLGLLLASCLLLVPWTIGLAVLLPVSYNADDWRLAWVGLDVAMVLTLAASAWAAWRHRLLLVVTSVVTGTLLLCDAWFDVLFASTWRDEALAVAAALLVEVPLALTLFAVARRMLQVAVTTGPPVPVATGPLWRMPLPAEPAWPWTVPGAHSGHGADPTEIA